MNKTYWGYHFQLDLRNCNENAIWPNEDKIYSFTKELVEAIDMVAYGEPQIVHFGTGNKSGYTLIQLIETSNIAAHFCDESGDVYLDIFSCKEFSMKVVMDLVKKWFEPEYITPFFRNRQA